MPIPWFACLHRHGERFGNLVGSIRRPLLRLFVPYDIRRGQFLSVVVIGDRVKTKLPRPDRERLTIVTYAVVGRQTNDHFRRLIITFRRPLRTTARCPRPPQLSISTPSSPPPPPVPRRLLRLSERRTGHACIFTHGLGEEISPTACLAGCAAMFWSHLCWFAFGDQLRLRCCHSSAA
jgi:hypothetical protein